MDGSIASISAESAYLVRGRDLVRVRGRARVRVRGRARVRVGVWNRKRVLIYMVYQVPR